jgi:hypothetical protein
LQNQFCSELGPAAPALVQPCARSDDPTMTAAPPFRSRCTAHRLTIAHGFTIVILIRCQSPMKKRSSHLLPPLQTHSSTRSRLAAPALLGLCRRRTSHRVPPSQESPYRRPHAPTLPPSRSPIVELPSAVWWPRSAVAPSASSAVKTSPALATLRHGPPLLMPP